MNEQQMMEMLDSTERSVEIATPGMDLLGPLKELPGLWKNEEGLEGRGWNMIALPFIASDGPPFDYRVLMNQYNEKLTFSLIDTKVPNRGVNRQDRVNKDQFVVTLDYQQQISQIAAADMPESGLEGNEGADIHHEPGLFLNMVNFKTDDIDIARLGTIPHGNSLLALGKSEIIDGPPQISPVQVLPIGTPPEDVDNNGYLAPYRHFRDNPFLGLFNVLEPDKLLAASTPKNVVQSSILTLDTTLSTGGVVNIPFIEKHADATEMKSTFWIMQLDEEDENGNPAFIMQYMQVVMLEFFERRDNVPGLVKWPHVSFNTMRRFPLPENMM